MCIIFSSYREGSYRERDTYRDQRERDRRGDRDPLRRFNRDNRG